MLSPLICVTFHVEMLLKEMCMSESQYELSFQLFTGVQKTTKKCHLNVNVFRHVSTKVKLRNTHRKCFQCV